MPPPPSFRKGKISIRKPDLPVQGWQNRICFSEESKDEDNYEGTKKVIEM